MVVVVVVDTFQIPDVAVLMTWVRRSGFLIFCLSLRNVFGSSLSSGLDC